MIGVFVQVNTGSMFAKAYPVGYVVQENGCWEWTGATNGSYGVMVVGKRGHGKRFGMAHRIVYERERGPVPDGLTLDHLCRNHLCVRPDHLEPVTIAVNCARGYGFAAMNARKDRCDNGHEYTPGNTYRYPDGRRECRTCSAAYKSAWQAKYGRKRDRLAAMPALNRENNAKA
jgi:hypothetical protein